MDFPARSRRWRHSGLRIVAVLALAMLGTADLAMARFKGPDWLVLPVVTGVLLTGFAAVLLPPSVRPGWLSGMARAVVPATLSFAVSLAGQVVEPRPSPSCGPAEVTVLLCLLVIMVRGDGLPARRAAVAVFVAVTLLTLPLRLYDSERVNSAVAGYEVALVLLTLSALGLGLYLRSRDNRRRSMVTEVRRAERLAIAADLHDFVAHHVTAILLQTQMARVLAGTDPARLDPVLAEVEQSATEALASMRRTVGMLRSEAVSDRPVGDFAQIGDLVGDFTRLGPARATLRRDASVPDDAPPEVQAAAYRVVQEALTNVRRHAADATQVAVLLHRTGGDLAISVQDDGQGAAAFPETVPGGGFGLIGLTERMALLGGTLRAGPRQGGGWEIVAVVPTGRGGADRAGSAP